jgi:hypothetical protein
MWHGFERMCSVYEALTTMVQFFYLHNHVYYTIYINVDVLITIYFYVCRWNMKMRNIKKQANQENIK